MRIGEHDNAGASPDSKSYQVLCRGDFLFISMTLLAIGVMSLVAVGLTVGGFLGWIPMAGERYVFLVLSGFFIYAGVLAFRGWVPMVTSVEVSDAGITPRASLQRPKAIFWSDIRRLVWVEVGHLEYKVEYWQRLIIETSELRSRSANVRIGVSRSELVGLAELRDEIIARCGLTLVERQATSSKLLRASRFLRWPLSRAMPTIREVWR